MSAQKKPSRGFRAFTSYGKGILRVLSNEVGVAPAFNPKETSEDDRPDYKSFRAIWDTGATASVITQRVADECGLQPIGMTKVRHVGGEDDSEVFLVNFHLPSDVTAYEMRVTKGNIAGMGHDILIGMDVISKGDFSVTSVGGKTQFSFRTPSIAHIDYVKAARAMNPDTKAAPKPGRNDPCPCGSGKKYKKCCGKDA